GENLILCAIGQYEVITADNGEDAVQKCRGNNVEIVVSDMTMPKLGGVDMLKSLKEIDPQIEVIMVTGCATLESAVESMKLGAYDYITKPFDIDNLSRLVARALEKRHLNQKVDELKEINRFKSEFLANMSHELRTPMNAILGYTSLHLDRLYGEINQKQEEALKRVEASGKNLLHLINSILDLSKINAGRMPIYLEEFDLKDLAGEVLKMMDCLAKTKQLELKSDIPDNTRLRSDKTKVKQILINLVNNGIKFTSSGGIYITANGKPGQPVFSMQVRDTGIGIKTEDMPSLFQEFKQLDASPTREYGGTGLGLVISRKFAQLLGGDIAVESKPGSGSTFT
ncbi:MAG TPA: ATP-binding protein, partial [Elusimicrobiales bacterium]|nr:ATP-binding protein [Elusimicrobiales bacterium]